MPSYKPAPVSLKNRREEIKKSLDEERDILNEKEPERESLVAPEASDSMMKTQNDASPRTETKNEEDENKSSDTVRKVGRPKKDTSIIRDISVSIKFNKESIYRLREIKLNYEINMQDLGFIAINEYIDRHFPKGKATKEDLKDILEKVEALNRKSIKK